MLYFISSLEIPFFESAKPFLFTTYFSSWSQLFVENVNWMNLMFDVIVLVVHVLLFYVLAVTIFNKKEIYE
jgi:ABC-type transport system involved in multi-copper enzyme maturation permease subunit